MAQALANSKSLQVFAHPTVIAVLAYFEFGLCGRDDRRGPAVGSLLLESSISGLVVCLVSPISMSSMESSLGVRAARSKASAWVDPSIAESVASVGKSPSSESTALD